MFKQSRTEPGELDADFASFAEWKPDVLCSPILRFP
jgi:hypothetical protein